MSLIEDDGGLFGGFDVIHTVTRLDLIESGDLIDVTDRARRAHAYRIDAAITVEVQRQLGGVARHYGVPSWENLLDGLLDCVRANFQINTGADGVCPERVDLIYCGLRIYAVLDTVGGCKGITILMAGED